MRFVLPALMALAATASSPALANNKTLFKNGVFAPMYGDILVESGKWKNSDDYYSTRVRVGVQALRWEFLGLGLGFQKNGFYEPQNLKDTRFDYTGPFAELYAFPNSLFGFSVAYSDNKGYSDRALKEGDAIAMPVNAETCPYGCKMDTERSEIRVQELLGQLTIGLSKHVQVVLGAGSRNINGTPYYLGRTTAYESAKFPAQSRHDWRYDGGKWKESGGFFTIGIRGTDL